MELFIGKTYYITKQVVLGAFLSGGKFGLWYPDLDYSLSCCGTKAHPKREELEVKRKSGKDVQKSREAQSRSGT
jgi:hypothetical protein